MRTLATLALLVVGMVSPAAATIIDETKPTGWVPGEIRIYNDDGIPPLIVTEVSARDRNALAEALMAVRWGALDGVRIVDALVPADACENSATCGQAVQETCEETQHGNGESAAVHRELDGSTTCEGSCEDGEMVVIVCAKPGYEPMTISDGPDPVQYDPVCNAWPGDPDPSGWCWPIPLCAAEGNCD